MGRFLPRIAGGLAFLLVSASAYATTSFPGGLDSYPNYSSGATLNNPSHSQVHTNVGDAIEALQAKVGANSATGTTTHDFKLQLVTGNNKAFPTIGGTLSGAIVILMPGFTMNTVALETPGQISGATLFANRALRSSGTLVFEGAGSGSSLYLGSSLEGAGLVSCSNATSSKLLWDSTTKRFSCGTDQDTGGGGGMSISAGDARYVNQSGDTMTGALAVNVTGGNQSTVGINVLQTLSGSVIRAQKSLATSGSLVVEGGSFSINGLAYSFPASQSAGTFLRTDGNGALTWSSVPAGFGSGQVLTIGDGRYVRTAGSTMTGALTITVTGGTSRTLGLEVLGTVSGSHLRAQDQLTSSGTLVVEGAMSGSSLFLGTSLRGAGLTDCDSATQTLSWDTTAGRFGCGTDSDSQNLFETIAVSGQSDVVADSATDTLTLAAGANVTITTTAGSDTVTIASTDTNTTYTAGQGLSLVSTSFRTNATLSGTLIRFTTVSGSTLFGLNSVASSGALTWEGVGSGASLYLGGFLDGAGLVSCSNATTSKLLWNSTTKRFSCGTDTDTDTNTTYTAGQGLALNGTVFTLNSTITGSLVRFTTLSGSAIKANNSLASSGTLVWEGQASGAALYIGGTLEGVGLTDCDASNQTLSWDATTKRFGCGTDDTAGSGLGLSEGDARYVNQSGDTMTGALVILVTGGTNRTLGLEVFGTASGSHVHAQDLLTSSGALSIEGTLSGSSIFGFGLATDCDNGTSSKLLWDATLGRFSCGSDQTGGGSSTFGSGNVVALGDPRYVNTAGDTMTGALVLNITGGSQNTLGLRVINTLSGASLHAEQLLTSSGSLIVEGATTLNNTVTINATATATDFQCTDCLTFTDLGDSMSLDTTTDINLGSASLRINHNGAGDMIWFNSVGGVTTTHDQSGALTVNDAQTDDGDFLVQGLTAASLVFADVSADKVGIGGSPNDALLEIFGVSSGRVLHANDLLRSSGALALEGGFFQDGLNDCDNAGEKPVYNLATGKWTCGTDDDVPESGDFAAAGDLDADGTITDGVIDKADFTISTDFGEISTDGSSNLTIDADVIGQSEVSDDALDFAELQDTLDVDANTVIVLGSNTLEIAGFLSGSVLHANDTLSSSGTLVFEGAASGSSLYLGTSLKGAGLTDCDADNQTVAWDASTGRFSCGDDDSTGSGLDQTAADERYVNQSGDTMTGALTVNLSSGYLGLKIIQTLSGSLVHAENGLSSSGAFVLENTFRMQTPTDSTTGFQVLDADGGTAVFNIDTTNERVGIKTASPSYELDVAGTIRATTGFTGPSGNFQIFYDTDNAAYFVNPNGAGTAVSANFATIVSGSTLYGRHTLASSGALVWEGAASGATMTISGQLDGVGLSDCDADNQTLSWDATTKRFGCGDDDNSGGTGTFGTGNVITIGDSRYVLTQGDTMTGALIILPTGGNNRTLALEAVGTLSGSHLRAQDLLTSSGAFIIDGYGVASASYVATMQIQSAGAEFFRFLQADGQDSILLTTTTSDAGKLALHDSNGSETVSIGGAAADIYFFTSQDVGINTNDPDVPGFGLEVVGIMSGATVQASRTLASSGALVVEGTAFIGGTVTLSTPLGLDSGGTNKNITAVNGGIIYSDADSFEVTAASSTGQILIGQGAAAPIWKNQRRTFTWYIDGGLTATTTIGARTQALYTCTLTDVVMTTKEAPGTQALIIDINRNGATIFSTRPQIAAGANTGGGNAVFSTTTITGGSILSLDIDQVGTAPDAGTGATILLSGNCT